MAEEAGGGGGGQEIFSLFGSVGVDIGGVLADLAKLESATSSSARQQQQYLASINRAWEEASRGSNRSLTGYLATARAAMQAGQSFSQAMQSLKAMQTPREAIQGLQQFKTAIDSVAQSNKALQLASNPKAIAEYTQELQRAAREAGRRVQLPGGQIVTITDQNRAAIARLAREQAIATETSEAATRQWNKLVDEQKRAISTEKELADIQRRANDPNAIRSETNALRERSAEKQRYLRTQNIPGGQSWIHEEGDDAANLTQKFGEMARAQARAIDGNSAMQRSYNALVAAERAVIAEEERMAQMRARAVTAQQNTIRQETRIAEIRANMQRDRPQAQPGPQFERDSPIDAARQNFYSARNAWMQTGRPGPELARFNQTFQAVNQARWGRAAPFPGEGQFNQSDVARRAAALRAQATPQFEREVTPEQRAQAQALYDRIRTTIGVGHPGRLGYQYDQAQRSRATGYPAGGYLAALQRLSRQAQPTFRKPGIPQFERDADPHDLATLQDYNPNVYQSHLPNVNRLNEITLALGAHARLFNMPGERFAGYGAHLEAARGLLESPGEVLAAHLARGLQTRIHPRSDLGALQDDPSSLAAGYYRHNVGALDIAGHANDLPHIVRHEIAHGFDYGRMPIGEYEAGRKRSDDPEFRRAWQQAAEEQQVVEGWYRSTQSSALRPPAHTGLPSNYAAKNPTEGYAEILAQIGAHRWSTARAQVMPDRYVPVSGNPLTTNAEAYGHIEDDLISVPGGLRTKERLIDQAKLGSIFTPEYLKSVVQFERDTPAHVGLTPGARERLMFHGSASDVRHVDPARLGTDNLAGRGFYLTSDPRVAGGIVHPREGDEPLIREQGYAQRRTPEWEDSSNARRYAEEFEKSLAEGPTHTGTYWVKDWRQTEARQRAGGVDEEGNFWPEEHTRAMAAHWRQTADEAAALERTGPNVTPFRVPGNLRTISLDDAIQPGLALRLANLVHPHPPAFVPGQHDVVDISGKRVHTAASKAEAAEHLAAMHASGINRDFYRINRVEPEHLAGRRSEALSRRRRLVGTLTNTNRYDNDTGWFRLLEEAAAPTREPHELLSQVGIEGIRYQGGVRIPLIDEAGEGIEHEALAVLPAAAHRVNPYFRGNAPQFEREFGAPRGPTPGEAVAAAALARLTPGFRAGQLPKADQLRYLGMAENPPAVAALGRRTGPLDVAHPTVTAALRRLHPDDLQFIRGIRPYGAGEREGYEQTAAALGAGGGAARAQTLAGQILYRPDILGDPNRAASTFAHETGHTIFNALPEQMQQRYAQQFRPDAGQRGMEGATTFAEHLRRGGEPPPTNYAFSSIGEDFAEAFRVHRGFTRDWERGENVQLGAGRRGFMGDVDTWLRGQGGAQFETERTRRSGLRGALPTGGQSGLAGLIRTAIPFAQWAAVNNRVARRDTPNLPPLTAEEVRGRVEAAGGRPSGLPPIPPLRQFGYEDLDPDLQRDLVTNLGQRNAAISRTRAFGRSIPNRNQFVQGLTGLTPGTPEHAQLFQAAQGAGALRSNVARALLNQRASLGVLAPYGPPVTPPVNGFAAQITPAVPAPAVAPAAAPAAPVITPAGAVRTIGTPSGLRYLLTPAAGGSPTFIGAGAAAAMGVAGGAATPVATPVPPAAGPAGPAVPAYARYWGAITGAVGGAGAAAAGAVGGLWGAAFGAGAGGGPGGGRPPTPPPAPPPAGAAGGGAPFYPYANTPGRGAEWATTRGEADVLEREATLQGELNGLLAVSEAHYRRIYDAAHRVVTEQERSLLINQRSTAAGITAARTQAGTQEARDANVVNIGGQQFRVTNTNRRQLLEHAAATNRAARGQRQVQEQFDEAGGGGGRGGGGGGGTLGGIGRLSPANLLRIGAGVFGIPLGINIFAGIARDIHGAIQTAIEDQIKWQQQVRATAAVYGSQLTPAIETSAVALSQSPAFKGTAAQFLQAQTEARGVLGARNVGFSAENQTQVVQLAGAFARLHPEVGDAQKATSELNTLLVSGGQGWQRYGIDLSDATVALHQLGSESAVALTSQTEATQADLRRKEALRQVTEQIRNAGDAQSKAADQADAQARANDRLGLALGKLFTGPGTGASNITTGIATGVAGAVEGTNLDNAVNDIATQRLKAEGYTYGFQKFPLMKPQAQWTEGLAGGQVQQPEWWNYLGFGEADAQRIQRERREAARKEVEAQAQQILKEGNYTVNQAGVPTAVEAGGQRRVIAPEQGQQLLQSAQQSAAQRILTRPTGGVENPADPAMQQALDQAGVKIDENNGKVTAGKEAWRSVFDEISQGNETLKLGVQYSEQLVSSAERLAGIIEQRPGGLLGLSDADISGVASYRAQVDALRASAANIATAGAEGGTTVATDYLQSVVEAAKTSPTPQRQREAQAAQNVLDNPEKLAQYRQQEEGLETARRQQQRADLQAGQAQYRQQLLQQQEQQRQLDRANELAKIRTTVLNLDSLAAPLQLQQTVVQDRLNVLARENLSIQQNLLQARQAQLATTERLSETDYRMRHNQAEAAVIQARIIRGEAGPEDVARLNVLRADQFKLALRRPEEALADLETGRGVEVVQQQQTRDQLARQLASIPLQAQQYNLTDQLVAIKEARDAEQARADAINRSLELATAAQQPAKTLADQAVLEAQAVKARADDEERYWKARIAGIAYERTQAPQVTTAEARARDLGWTVTPGATVPNPEALRVPNAVPVGAGQTPIDLRGATINNVADIERIATQAAAEASANAYNTVKTTLLQVFNNAQPDLPGTMTGVQR